MLARTAMPCKILKNSKNCESGVSNKNKTKLAHCNLGAQFNSYASSHENSRSKSKSEVINAAMMDTCKTPTIQRSSCTPR